MDMVTLLRTLLETASAMAHLHKLGVVHCDLKPANILLKSSANDTRGFTVKASPGPQGPRCLWGMDA